VFVILDFISSDLKVISLANLGQYFVNIVAQKKQHRRNNSIFKPRAITRGYGVFASPSEGYGTINCRHLPIKTCKPLQC